MIKEINASAEKPHVALLPDNVYTDTIINGYPCIIFLHGSGERGTGSETDLLKTIKEGPAAYLKDNRFIVLCPQVGGWSWRSTKTVNGVKVVTNQANEFTKWALQNYPIDPARVYITGLSMGGEGAYFAMADDPDLYAAGAPVCGRASRSEGDRIAGAGVHVWAFHGEDDTSIPFEQHWNAIVGMRARNKAMIDFTVYERMGHGIWDKVYANQALYTWFLKWRKVAP